MAKKKVNLVLEGGGVKGIGLVGAIAALDKTGFDKEKGYDQKDYNNLVGYDWNFLAGTSAGAIIATLLAVGYTGKELFEELNKLDPVGYDGRSQNKRCFLDVIKATKFWPCLFFKIPQLLELWNRLDMKHGLFEGKEVERLVRELIKKKTGESKYTFGNLAECYPSEMPTYLMTRNAKIKL
ncbi:MAG: hypothetical protein HC797_05725, partial [Anaerolineales bacterium]|nr:hypothetical protein [Anaerolineales bacterium]